MGVMKNLTAPRMERCIGCHSCSLACARLVHKNLSWDRTGVRIKSSEDFQRALKPTYAWPAIRPCAEACPTGAYSQRKGGGVIVKKKRCIRAGSVTKRAGGRHIPGFHRGTLCVHPLRPVRAFCPHDCLELSEEEQDSPQRRRRESSIPQRGRGIPESGNRCFKPNTVNLPAPLFIKEG